MKILKIIGIVVAAIVAVLVIIGLVSPKNYDVKRDIVINAPADVVFKTVSHYSELKKWSPWQELDTTMTTTLDGTDGTVGAKYSWKGNDKVGEGAMTITKVEEGKTIEHDLSFIKPFESRSTTYMNTEAAEGGTKVTWGMKGESGFVERIMMTLMGGMDGAVGKDYEKGLAQLKTVCESGSGAAASVYEVKEVDWAAKECLAIRQVVEFKDFAKFMGEHYPKMFAAIGTGKAKPGIPLGVYYDYDEAGMKADLAVAIPYEGGKVLAKGYSNLDLPARKGYTIDYWGDYAKMMPAYDAMTAKLKELGKENPDMVIEEYITDPMNEKDTAKWNTKIYFFVNSEEAMK